MDKEAFYEYLIIPMIEDFNNYFNSSDDEKNIEAYIKLADLTVSIECDQNFNAISGIKRSRSLNDIFEICEFNGLDIFEPLRLTFTDGSDNSGLQKIIERNNLTFIRQDNRDLIILEINSLPWEDVLELYKKYGTLTSFQVFFDKIKKMEKNTRDELLQLKNNKADLWDF